MFPIEIDIRPLAANTALVRANALRLASRLGRMREPLIESVEKVVIPSIGMNFLLMGRPVWEILAQSTYDRKVSPLMLIETGKLIRAATSRAIWSISEHEANMKALDAQVPYAKYHQGGTKRMPQRQFALLQSEDVEKIVEIFDRWLSRVATQNDWYPLYRFGG